MLLLKVNDRVHLPTGPGKIRLQSRAIDGFEIAHHPCVTRSSVANSWDAYPKCRMGYDFKDLASEVLVLMASIRRYSSMRQQSDYCLFNFGSVPSIQAWFKASFVYCFLARRITFLINSGCLTKVFNSSLAISVSSRNA